MGLENDNPTAEELILQLRSSFFSSEFEQIAKSLMEREEQLKDRYLKLKTKFKEEKDVIFKENVKLKDQLKNKEEEIDVMRKQIAEYEKKVRVYENQDSMDSSLNLAERCTPPGFAENKGSKHKSEAKLPEIINLDDDGDQEKRVRNEIKSAYDTDDDDGLEFISSIKTRQTLKKTKREHHGESAKISPVLEKIELDPEPDLDSDTENVNRLYMSSIARVKKAKEGWKSESDMVKDFEKDDELCLNGVCALYRQRTIVHGSDIERLSTLARKLIDGDPQNELKKKASDLNRFDLDDCQMYAKKYSLQLFNIHQEKSDLFFPATRS